MEYKQSKNNRIKSFGFHSISCEGTPYLWYSEKSKKWETLENTQSPFSNHKHCRSLRAFRRSLKKAPKNRTYTLISRWIGYDIRVINK